MRNTQILCNQPCMSSMGQDIGLDKLIMTNETKSRINPSWTSWIDGKKSIEDIPSIFLNTAITTAAAAATSS